jgi:hypothetical protein
VIHPAVPPPTMVILVIGCPMNCTSSKHQRFFSQAVHPVGDRVRRAPSRAGTTDR